MSGIEKNLDKALTEIQSQLVIPVIVGYMLRGLEPFDEIAEYTMDDMIGSMWPDSALLTIAFSAKQIADHNAHIPMAAALGIEASRIIAAYAPLWIAHSRNIPANGDDIRDLLTNIPEDFEALCDLLDVTGGELAESTGPARPLCELMSAQALAHKSFAEYKLETMGILESALRFDAGQSETSNVIAFPGKRL